MLTNLFFVLVLMTAMPQAPSVSVEPIVNEATINAPVDELWKLFTTKEGVESWMVTRTEIDLRIGGLWRTSYSKTSTLDDDASIHHVIMAFDPGRMLSFRTIRPPKNFPFPNAILKTWNVVYFEPAGTGRTKVTLRMMGYGEDEESQRMRKFFEAGNKATLDELSKKFR